MSPAEMKAFRNATLVLVALSVLRWWGSADEPGPQGGGPSALPEIRADASRELEEAQRRSTPLGPGERLDPNRVTAVELDRLPGVGRTTAEAMVREREQGSPFRAPDDLLRVPGIGPATVERIGGHLDFSQAPPVALSRRRTQAPDRVDLGRATAGELESLPGIGPALAQRIMEVRASGGLARVDDLLAVRGIGPATLERLRPLVRVGGKR